MTDATRALVERLREEARWYAEIRKPKGVRQASLLREAADEIERLEQERDQALCQQAFCAGP